MTAKIVECIPNFSEGRRPEVIEQIVAEITAVDGVTLLDYSSDKDHNRSVVTFVGVPGAVEEAAFAAIKKAAELIDLDKQEGAHPRMGATDVVPFVPISGVTMADCIEMARRVGKRVGEELKIPVFLYEKAATHSDRANLAKIRKGEYETIKEEIGSSPVRTPDFGPQEVGSAGTVAIGARDPLVAYNVYLNTDDVEIATKISKAVRHLSGGLRYVKGLGMLVDGQAQVSMNLTNYKRTPVHRVVEMIRREAARYGVSITHSELIGLIPQQAIIDAASWYLQLDDFDNEQVLEIKMQAAQSAEGGTQVEDSFVDALASGAPTPGGGSAAAHAGAMGAGLVAMVARLSVNKKRYKDVEAQMFDVVERADSLRAELSAAVEEDAAAFMVVMDAFKLPKGTEEEKSARAKAIEAAMLGAALVPLDVATKAVQVMEMAVLVAEVGNINAISDGASGAAMARAALTSASLNVRINVKDFEDRVKASELMKEVWVLEAKAKELEDKLNDIVRERGGLED